MANYQTNLKARIVVLESNQEKIINFLNDSDTYISNTYYYKIYNEITDDNLSDVDPSNEVISISGVSYENIAYIVDFNPYTETSVFNGITSIVSSDETFSIPDIKLHIIFEGYRTESYENSWSSQDPLYNEKIMVVSYDDDNTTLGFVSASAIYNDSGDSFATTTTNIIYQVNACGGTFENTLFVSVFFDNDGTNDNVPGSVPYSRKVVLYAKNNI
jgi:hypothetical protein